MTNVYKKWLKLTLKMAQCSVVYDLSFDMLDTICNFLDKSQWDNYGQKKYVPV